MEPIVAYLDPLTGSVLTQVALGAAAVVSLGYHFTRRRFSDFVRRFRRTGPEEPAERSARTT